MPESRQHRKCKQGLQDLLGFRGECPVRPGHRSDACGYYNRIMAYGEVDCRRLPDGRMGCWISIYDHETHDLLYSFACPDTPAAGIMGRDYFVKKEI